MEAAPMGIVSQGAGTLTIPETAQRLGVTPATLRRAIANDEVPFHVVRIGKLDRIPATEVAAVLGGLDLAGAQKYLTETLPPGEAVVVEDAKVLDAAASVIARARK
jgi:excisionase family DNA binding protein